MSNNTHDNHKEHSAMQSYVAGFIQSLIFTVNAYYLVVSKTLTGNTLLVTILGLAFLQMLVQIFFFLHLGRGPKPLYNIIFFVGTVGIIAFVVFGSIFIMDNLHYNMTPSEVIKKLSQNESITQLGGEKTGACNKVGTRYRVTINNGKVTPTSTAAQLCDTLTFINEDNNSYSIVFGPHAAHKTYGGETGVSVRKGNSKTITLNQTGMHLFHDETNQAINGSFTVGE